LKKGNIIAFFEEYYNLGKKKTPQGRRKKE